MRYDGLPEGLVFSWPVRRLREDQRRTGRGSFMSRGLSRGEGSWQLLQGLVGAEGALSLELDGDGMTWAVGMGPCERRGWKDNVPLELEWSGDREKERLNVDIFRLICSVNVVS